MEKTKWSWKLFGIAAAIAIAATLLLSVWFIYINADGFITFIACASVCAYSLYYYAKNVVGPGDYSMVSLLLGAWSGAILAALSFVIFIVK